MEQTYIYNMCLFSFNNLFLQLVRWDFTPHFYSMILVSFIYYCVTTHSKTCWFKQQPFYLFMILSLSQASALSCSGSLMWMHFSGHMMLSFQVSRTLSTQPLLLVLFVVFPSKQHDFLHGGGVVVRVPKGTQNKEAVRSS